MQDGEEKQAPLLADPAAFHCRKSGGGSGVGRGGGAMEKIHGGRRW